MSVLFNFRPNTRPYAGYQDPSLPIASWIASATVTGNGTGGSVFMTILMQLAETVRVTEMFNLEQVAIDVGTGFNITCMVRTLEMDALAPNIRFPLEQRWTVVLLTDGVDEAAMALADGAGLPVWLGAPSALGSDSGLRFEFINTDLLVYTVTAQGYIWGPRSVVAPGGPQRPPFGYFGK